MKENFSFPSADGKTRIHGVIWKPDTGSDKPRAVIQLVHGMLEYIERYNEFAEFLTSLGYVVFGHDHLGHGQSVRSVEDWGYIAERTKNTSPTDIMLHDINRAYLKVSKMYPDAPYFILGHSMGSYLTRSFLSYEGNRYVGAIIMGTGHEPDAVTVPGLAFIHSLAKVHGWRYRSTVVRDMSYEKPYKLYDLTNEDTSRSWLSKRVANVEAYKKEPRCTFLFTLNGYDALVTATNFAAKKKNINRIPKDLPLLFVSGSMDPVGGLGKGVDKVVEMYRACGIQDIEEKLFADDRHEILQEDDRSEVYFYIEKWISKKLGF